MREMRPLASVDVDGQGDRALSRDPFDVGAQPVLVDAPVGMHRQDRGGDQAVEVEGHECSELDWPVADILEPSGAGLRRRLAPGAVGSDRPSP